MDARKRREKVDSSRNGSQRRGEEEGSGTFGTGKAITCGGRESDNCPAAYSGLSCTASGGAIKARVCLCVCVRVTWRAKLRAGTAFQGCARAG